MRAPPGVVDADERAAHPHGQVHDLDDLLGEDLAQAAAEDGEVLAEQEDLAAVDRAVAGHDAVAPGAVVLQAEAVGAVAGEHVELGEAARVEQQVDALAGGELAARVLALDGRLGARVARPPRAASRSRSRFSPVLTTAAARTRSYSPNSARMTPQTSPTVARARSASRRGGSRLAVPRAAARTSSSRASTRAASRLSRRRAQPRDLVDLDLRDRCAGGTPAARRPRGGRSRPPPPGRRRRPPRGGGRRPRAMASRMYSMQATAPPRRVDLLDQLAGPAPRSRP